MNHKRRFKAKIKVDPSQVFGGQTLEQVLVSRQKTLQNVLQRLPSEQHEMVHLKWKIGDERIRRIFRGDATHDDLQGLVKVRVHK